MDSKTKPVEGGRLRKSKAGTKEMKDKMAKLRAMRGKSKGEGLGHDLKVLGRKIKKYIPIRGLIKGAATMALEGATGNPLLAGMASPATNQMVDAGLDKANLGFGLRKSKIPVRKLKGGSMIPAGY